MEIAMKVIKKLKAFLRDRCYVPILQKQAKHRRRRLGTTIIGITGTNGTTTTKELVSAVLSRKYNTISTQGNFNNHIGVPLTLRRLRLDTKIAVVEMGANHPGEIAFLCNIAHPNYGLITNIGKAHIEGFGSFEGVVNTKKELYDYLRTHGGEAIVNGDNTLLMGLSDGLKRYTYGSKAGNECVVSLVSCSPFLKVNATGVGDIQTRLVGDYNFENVAAAIAVGLRFGVDSADIKASLESYEPQNGRSQMIETENNLVEMDAYNANPTSMSASITSFKAICGDKPLLILGDMLELGDASGQEHRAILKLIKHLGFNEVFLVGQNFSQYNDNPMWGTFATVDDLITHLKQHPVKGRTILVKGSHGILLEKVLDTL